jgi:hypothetical protein
MFDSVHIARWISQFKNANFTLILFPSSHFRNIHPSILRAQSQNIHVIGGGKLSRTFGYLDSLATLRFFGGSVAMVMRRFYLKLTIKVLRPQVIHAIEIQHAGYLISDQVGSSHRRILTNWGSDIYYFMNFENHINRIKEALKWATHYSAECERDYKLASELGFSGVNLPRIPNAGGFEISKNEVKCSDRKLILIKTYGGQFGAAKIAIKAIADFLSKNHNFEVFFYSVTRDVIKDVEKLRNNFPNLVKFSTLENPLSQDEILALFHKSRIYLGCSISDGLSTSFLQALIAGAYPIQTNTSCASELTFLGAAGSIINPSADEILFELNAKINDEKLLNESQKINLEFSRKYLEKNHVSQIASAFYEI